MSEKAFFNRVGFSAIIVALTGLVAFGTPTMLQNGDFSAGLTGWTVESGDVYERGGEAVFEEDFYNSSTLSQEFTIPDFAQKLSFNVRMESPGPESPVDVFRAYLYDNSIDLNPLVSITGVDEFFYIDDLYYVETAGMFDMYTGTVSVDISDSNTFWNKDAYLVFKLESGDEVEQTSVYIDNVIITVPAPGALALGLIGAGAVGLWHRFSRGI